MCIFRFHPPTSKGGGECSSHLAARRHPDVLAKLRAPGAHVWAAMINSIDCPTLQLSGPVASASGALLSKAT
ncbi:MAG: hypothetical protein HND51_22765 [Chloroflexi bacterium]|nr:hypothetical protein [Chloroflexota bacterium]